jgi:D-alanine-D-alanine ligase
MGKLSALAGEKFAVKPNSLGSSLGVRIVDSRKLKPTVELALRKYGEVLVEKFLDGPEFSVPVLGNARPLALPVIEIVPRKGKFFDYQSKYQAGGSDEIVPARIPAALSEQMQHHAMAVHMALGCRGLTRTDLIVANGVPYFLEINTIPGLTTASLAPKSAAAAGIKFPQLLDKLIRLANYK